MLNRYQVISSHINQTHPVYLISLAVSSGFFGLFHWKMIETGAEMFNSGSFPARVGGCCCSSRVGFSARVHGSVILINLADALKPSSAGLALCRRVVAGS